MLAVGSAGSNRIRSAILQTVVRSIDEGLSASEAVDAPRLHWEDGVVYTEPGIDGAALPPPATSWPRSGSPTCSSAGCRPPRATRPGASRGAGIHAAVAPRSW